jgi:hypothetical protein
MDAAEGMLGGMSFKWSIPVSPDPRAQEGEAQRASLIGPGDCGPGGGSLHRVIPERRSLIRDRTISRHQYFLIQARASPAGKTIHWPD